MGNVCYNLTRMTIYNPEKIHQLNALIELSALINSSLNIVEIRKRTVEAAVRLVDAETGSLLFVDEESGGLYFDVALGEMGGYRETFYATVYALADTIEKRDPYTGGHTRRVMNYSLAIGKTMGLSPKEMIDLKLSAILHDIGKIGIKDSILLKNEQLTFDEYNVIIMHPGYGAEILTHIRQLREIVPGVKWHHEKYDGSGYPEGLKGEAIPLIARIISVADTFDAMTTDRPYRKGLSTQATLEELGAKAGSQFDPVVVDAFVKAFSDPESDRPGAGE